MSLHHYEIDLSQLSNDEKTDLVERLKEFSFTSFHWHDGFESGSFFLDDKNKLKEIKIPSTCCVTEVL